VPLCDASRMLKTLRDLFDTLAAPLADAAPEQTEHQLQLATAVLLVEVMRADAEFSDAERRAVQGALRDKFALAPDECDRLADLAVSTASEATDYHAFTSRLNARFSMEQKLRMVEHMWRVAYADGTLTAHENHVMWRLADLLHVPHGAYINAKMRAREAPAG
jgi:uncharacterized tellurite resistance protein B-like protein